MRATAPLRARRLAGRLALGAAREERPGLRSRLTGLGIECSEPSAIAMPAIRRAPAASFRPCGLSPAGEVSDEPADTAGRRPIDFPGTNTSGLGSKLPKITITCGWCGGTRCPPEISTYTA